MEDWEGVTVTFGDLRRAEGLPPPLSLPGVFIFTPSAVRCHRPFPSSSSLDWMDDSIKRRLHPPSSSTSFTFSLLVVSALSKLLSIPHAVLSSYFLFSPPVASPLSLLVLSFRSALPSLPFSLSIRQYLSISISRLGSKVFKDRQHPHSSSQNTTKHK